MNSPIIRCEGVGKKYFIQHNGGGGSSYTALRDVLARRAKGLLRRSRAADASSTSEEFWALKDVSFEVQQGEVVGIIGRNGAGKSTLLKILSRITEPTTGRITLGGRVASLLEVGTGFHPELTGRENIFLNGAILGMTKMEIRKKFDEIVVFAEVEKFLDTPVKHYSSGMYVRLAFAVAAHLEPEILVVDEVLAVGDTQFQKKCLGKMGDVAKSGRTILFVSHNLAAVQQLCNRAVHINAGQVVDEGACKEVVGSYLKRNEEMSTDMQWMRSSTSRSHGASIKRIFLTQPASPELPVTQISTGDCVVANIEVVFHQNELNPQAGIFVHTAEGIPILDVRTRHTGLDLPSATGPVRLEARFNQLGLYPGDYVLSAWVGNSAGDDLDWVQYALNFRVHPSHGALGDMRLNLNWGKYHVPAAWTATLALIPHASGEPRVSSIS